MKFEQELCRDCERRRVNNDKSYKKSFFLADTFVFETEGKKKDCYVMVNCDNKIESIGYSLTKRMSMPKDLVEKFHPGVKTMYSLDEIIEKSEEPTTAQKRAFNIIDEEFFLKIINSKSNNCNN